MGETSKKIINLISMISIMVAFLLTGTYAFLNLQANNSTASGQAGCFSVNYSAQVINTTDLVSTTDYTQGARSQVTLSKNSGCPLYTEASIYIRTNTSETTAPINTVKALKYKVLNPSNSVISEGVITTTNGEDLMIATVPLTTTATTYSVYIWVDSSISVGFYNDTSYSGYIYASSTQTSTIPTRVNEPNLDNGNLIPVYYDDSANQWKKADSSNANNSWYDYENKKWANAIIVENATKRATYQSATTGTTISDSDITAFYVWIPRFKYRVWNINRQGSAETSYAYSAYTNGIEIEFERGLLSSGNVTCSYDDQTTASSTYLSDNCSVKGTSVAYNTSNSTYGNSNPAWYTHPAFNLGNTPKTGFWIGKFETSGTVNSNNIIETPKILPDVQSIMNQKLSEQFMSSKNFQNYLTNSTLDAHMLTNLEWGAVAYLTHSIYGLCNGSSCSGVNNNDSSGYYTGRSSGDIANGTTSTYGTYNYKGYKLNNNTPTSEKDVTKVASTTKNITGVYDMSGSGTEYVMGNMVSTSNEFYPSSSDSKWEGTEWYDSVNNRLNTKYYNSYAYGTNYYGTIAFNRARLGDATAEVLGGTSSSYSSWKVGSGITGSYSRFVFNDSSWFCRGGTNSNGKSGLFFLGRYSGNNSDGYTFRSALS